MCSPFDNTSDRRERSAMDEAFAASGRWRFRRIVVVAMVHLIFMSATHSFVLLMLIYDFLKMILSDDAVVPSHIIPNTIAMPPRRPNTRSDTD